MIPAKHHGAWQGNNRLWFEGPEPERCAGTMQASATTLNYSWSFKGTGHEGKMVLFGSAQSVRAEWKDSWHMEKGMGLNGRFDAGRLLLIGTYPAGDGTEWGWTIELDCRDPEHLTMKMFNVQPGEEPVIAVDLHCKR